MPKQRTFEKFFAKQAQEAGFMVEQPRSIRIQTPVLDKNGERNKYVTTPDYMIKDPRTGQEFHVEVTSSSGNTPHKAAQQRVVEAAQVKNYRVITGDDILQLEELLNPDQKYILLAQLLGML